MILVEGTVGAGKSTLSDLISDHFRIPVFEELGNPDTEELLNRFYADRSDGHLRRRFILRQSVGI